MVSLEFSGFEGMEPMVIWLVGGWGVGDWEDGWRVERRERSVMSGRCMGGGFWRLVGDGG